MFKLRLLEEKYKELRNLTKTLKTWICYVKKDKRGKSSCNEKILKEDTSKKIIERFKDFLKRNNVKTSKESGGNRDYINKYLPEIITKIDSKLRNHRGPWNYDAIVSELENTLKKGNFSRYHFIAFSYFLRFIKEEILPNYKTIFGKTNKNSSLKEENIKLLEQIINKVKKNVNIPKSKELKNVKDKIFLLFEILEKEKGYFKKEEYNALYYFIRCLIETGARIEQLEKLFTTFKKNNQQIFVKFFPSFVVLIFFSKESKESKKRQYYFPMSYEVFNNLFLNNKITKVDYLIEKFKEKITNFNKNNKEEVFLKMTRKYFQQIITELKLRVLEGSLIEGRGLEEEVTYRHYLEHLELIKETYPTYLNYLYSNLYKKIFIKKLDKNKELFSLYYDILEKLKFSQNLFEKLEAVKITNKDFNDFLYEELTNKEGVNVRILKHLVFKTEK